jgi:hypothetical protein
MSKIQYIVAGEPANMALAMHDIVMLCKKHNLKFSSCPWLRVDKYLQSPFGDDRQLRIDFGSERYGIIDMTKVVSGVVYVHPLTDKAGVVISGKLLANVTINGNNLSLEYPEIPFNSSFPEMARLSIDLEATHGAWFKRTPDSTWEELVPVKIWLAT